MAVRIVLDNVVRYLNVVPAKKLEGLQQAVQAKAAELGISPGAVLTPPIQANQEPTGNVAGILRFVASVNADSSEADKLALGTLLAVCSARTGAAGLVAKPAEAEAAPTRRGRRGRRAK